MGCRLLTVRHVPAMAARSHGTGQTNSSRHVRRRPAGRPAWRRHDVSTRSHLVWISHSGGTVGQPALSSAPQPEADGPPERDPAPHAAPPLAPVLHNQLPPATGV